MTPERWQHVRQHLEHLLALEIAERGPYLDELDDADLRAELEDLLAQQARTDASSGAGDDGDGRSSLVANRYRVDRLLGRGGMGEVHLAFDEQLKRRVALKRVRFDRRGRDAALHRLRREAEANAALVHPHIATLYDVLSTGDDAVLVEEYVDGVTLESLIAAGSLSSDDVLTYTRQLLSAMSHAHDAGVVHCDLKPGNLMVTRTRQIKVLDFGIAVVATSALPTDTGSTTRHVVCTPRYAAPEVLRGQTPSPAADVYAIGLIVRECLERHVDGNSGRAARALRRVADEACDAEARRRPRDASALVARLDAHLSSRSRLASLRTAVPVSLLGAGCLGGGVLLWDAPDRLQASAPVVAVVTRVDDASTAALAPALAQVVVTMLAQRASVTIVTQPLAVEQVDRVTLAAQFRSDAVTHVVVPSVRRSGTRLVGSLTLLNVASDGIEWTQSFGVSPHRLGEITQQAVTALLTSQGWQRGGDHVAARLPEPADPGTLAALSQSIGLLERPDVPGNVAQARALLEGALVNDPAYTPLLGVLARAYVAAYDHDPQSHWLHKAQAVLLDAVRAAPDEPHTLLALARVHLKGGEPEKARTIAEAVAEREPWNDDALRLVGSTHAGAGRYDEAITWFEKAEGARPGFWGNVRQIGLAHYDAGRWSEAEASFERLTQLQPDSSFSWQSLGAVRQHQGRDDEALEAYGHAMRLAPSAESASNIGTIHYAHGRWPQATQAYRQAVEIAPREPVFRRNLADALDKTGRHGEAARTYDEGIGLALEQLQHDPRNHRLHALAAVCLAKRGRGDEAVTHAREAVSLSNGSWYAWLRLASVLAVTGARDEAVIALGRARSAGASAEAVRGDEDLVKAVGVVVVEQVLREVA